MPHAALFTLALLPTLAGPDRAAGLPEVVDAVAACDARLSVVLDHGLTIDVTVTRCTRTQDGHTIVRGRSSLAPATSVAGFTDFVAVVDPTRRYLHGLFDGPTGQYTIMPLRPGQHRIERLRQPWHAPLPDAGGVERTHPPARGGDEGETDDCGTHIIDLLFGYTQAAYDSVSPDPMGYALAAVEEVNVGFANSEIEDLQMRLVGIAMTDWSPTSAGFDALGEALDGIASGGVLLQEAQDVGADFVAITIAGVDGSGLAYMPGWHAANGISLAVFRHEWGHNAGSTHCPEDGDGILPYAAGWSADDDHKTHMCGNNLNLYSSPDIMVDGFTMGDAAMADNSRVLRERAGELSGHTAHVVPFEDCMGGGDTGTGTGTDGGTSGDGGTTGPGTSSGDSGSADDTVTAGADTSGDGDSGADTGASGTGSGGESDSGADGCACVAAPGRGSPWSSAVLVALALVGARRRPAC